MFIHSLLPSFMGANWATAMGQALENPKMNKIGFLLSRSSRPRIVLSESTTEALLQGQAYMSLLLLVAPS